MPSTTEHSQGWHVPTDRVSYEEPDRCIVNSNGVLVAKTYNVDPEAHAKLIAAAPALLEALREIETICTESNSTFRKRMGTRAGNALVIARAALAKAEA